MPRPVPLWARVGVQVDLSGDLAVGEHIERVWASLFYNLNTHQVFNMFLSKYSEQLSGAPLLRGQMPSPQQARPSA